MNRENGYLKKRNGDEKQQEILKEFGNYVKGLRTSKELTLQQVADELNVSANYISQIERGIRRPTNDLIIQFSKLFDIDEDILFRKSGRIPLRVIEELESNLSLQKAISYVRKKNLPPEKKKELEEEILRVYAEFLNVHKGDILRDEFSQELGVYDIVIISDGVISEKKDDEK